MKLQEQVCTLEQAQRLKELGCRQNAYFAWKHPSGEWQIFPRTYTHLPEFQNISAYTVAELGEMLAKLGETEIDAICENGEWTMAKGIETTPGLVRYIWHPTEAQARAARLIHRLETSSILPNEP